MAKSGSKAKAGARPKAGSKSQVKQQPGEQPLSELPFEQAFEQLAKLVDQLEQGELPLEESLAMFERGQALAARCDELLEHAELKLRQLVEQRGGDFEEADFEPEPDE